MPEPPLTADRQRPQEAQARQWARMNLRAAGPFAPCWGLEVNLTPTRTEVNKHARKINNFGMNPTNSGIARRVQRTASTPPHSGAVHRAYVTEPEPTGSSGDCPDTATATCSVSSFASPHRLPARRCAAVVSACAAAAFVSAHQRAA